MWIGRRSKSEQIALSRNSRNASRNTQTPMGSGFYILVPTVPTQNQYLYMRARKIFCSPPNKKISLHIHMVCREKKSESRNKRRKRPWEAGFRVPTPVPTVPTVPTRSGWEWCAMTEAAITEAIMRWLRRQGAHVIKTYGGPYRRGLPDLIGAYRGRAMAQ